MKLWTIGHSTRPIADFLALLREHRHRDAGRCPAFPGLAASSSVQPGGARDVINHAGARYEHFPELGGRRQPRKDSPNTAWRNDAFRGYADYMMTAEFEAGIARLLALAARTRTAIMCAEAVWWQCHRGLIADYLRAAGHDVIHIQGPNRTEQHPFTSAARIVNGLLTYSPEPDLLG
jgi:uncharacterized protein (DUF488 family)